MGPHLKQTHLAVIGCVVKQSLDSRRSIAWKNLHPLVNTVTEINYAHLAVLLNG